MRIYVTAKFINREFVMEQTQFNWGVFWAACGAIFQAIALVIMLLQWKEFTSYIKKNVRITKITIGNTLFIISILWLLSFGGYFLYLTIIQLMNDIPLDEIITFKNEAMKWNTIAVIGTLILGYTAMYLNGDISTDENGYLVKTWKIKK